MNFFSYDSKIIQILNKISDGIILNIVWLLCCIPVVTIGAATTALYYTVHKVLVLEESSILKVYFGTFRRVFKQSTQLWLILMTLYIIIGIDLLMIYAHIERYPILYALFFVMIVLLAVVMIWGKYCFPYLVRFSNSPKMILQETALLIVADLKRAILLLVVSVLELIGYYQCPLLLFVLPTICMIYVDYIMENAFEKNL